MKTVAISHTSLLCIPRWLYCFNTCLDSLKQFIYYLDVEMLERIHHDNIFGYMLNKMQATSLRMILEEEYNINNL